MASAQRLVVGAAILRGARLLAARRTRPEAAAGRWELPGGKVEPGEDPTQALVREVAEELGCEVEVATWLPGRTRIGEELVLAVAHCTLLAGEPEPREHDQVRWLSADGLDTVDWLDSDRPFLPALRALLLAETAGRLRAVFFEEADAGCALDRLRAAGFSAELDRERYAGEDDDEDHAWAVVTDAPLLLVDPLVDELGGWLDEDDPPAPEVAPLELPTAPRRHHRPTGAH